MINALSIIIFFAGCIVTGRIADDPNQGMWCYAIGYGVWYVIDLIERSDTDD